MCGALTSEVALLNCALHHPLTVHLLLHVLPACPCLQLCLCSRQALANLLDMRVQLAMLSNRQVRLDNPMLAARISKLSADVNAFCSEQPVSGSAGAGGYCLPGGDAQESVEMQQ